MISQESKDAASTLTSALKAKTEKKFGESFVGQWSTGVNEETIKLHEARLNCVIPEAHKAALLCADGFPHLDFYAEADRLQVGVQENSLVVYELRDWNNSDALALQKDNVEQWPHIYGDGAGRVDTLGAVKASLYEPTWVIIGATMYGTIFIDTKPEPRGVAGQVIFVEAFDYERNPIVRVIADNYLQFLSIVVQSV